MAETHWMRTRGTEPCFDDIVVDLFELAGVTAAFLPQMAVTAEHIGGAGQSIIPAMNEIQRTAISHDVSSRPFFGILQLGGVHLHGTVTKRMITECHHG
ncbi:MAG TPA: hypothetical protein DCQ94_18065 [Nitrospira sp.]|nr:hypothetical protein [Nitrospira sp.]